MLLESLNLLLLFGISFFLFPSFHQMVVPKGVISDETKTALLPHSLSVTFPCTR